MRRFFAALLAFATALAITPAVSARSADELTFEGGADGGYQCRTVDELFFSTDDITDKSASHIDYNSRYVQEGSDELANTPYIQSAHDGPVISRHFSTRKMMKSLPISTDRTVPEHVELYIPAGKTLTVEKGATLTLKGKLRVDGTLINHGTIAVEGKREVTVYNYEFRYNGRSGWHAEDEPEILYARIISTGRIENAGTLRIGCGQIENRGGAIENTGGIAVNNGKIKLHGIVNTTKVNKPAAGIVNSGAIALSGPAGYGIESNQGSSIQNDGSITTAGGALIKGKVTGKAVKVK